MAMEHIYGVSHDEAKRMFEAGVQYTDEEMEARLQRFEAELRKR